MTSLTGACAGPPSRFRTTALAIRVRWPMFPRLMPPAALGVTGTIRAAAGPGPHSHHPSVSPRPRLRDTVFWRAPATWQLVTPSQSHPHGTNQRTEAPRASELTLHAEQHLTEAPRPHPGATRLSWPPGLWPAPPRAPAQGGSQHCGAHGCERRRARYRSHQRLCDTQRGPSLPLALWPHKSPPVSSSARGDLASVHLHTPLPGAHGCSLLRGSTWPTGRPQAQSPHDCRRSPCSRGRGLLANDSPRLANARKRKPR